MNRLIIILASIFLSCGAQEPRYYPKNQWQIPGYNINPLKAKPLEVKEMLYTNPDDTATDTKGKFNNYDIWRFDREGNVSYRKYFQSDSFWMEFFSSYDRDGAHLMGVHHGIPDPEYNGPTRDTTEGSRSVLWKNGKIREVSNSGRPAARFISFSEGGDVEKVEEMKDTIDEVNPVSVTTYFYKGQQLRKIEMTSDELPPSTVVYHYSSRDFLDSIVGRSGGKNFKRHIFVNNEFGDPVRYLLISNDKDTVTDYTMQYEYDRRGNWIKKRERIHYNSQDARLFGGEYAFSISIREITYPTDQNNFLVYEHNDYLQTLRPHKIQDSAWFPAELQGLDPGSGIADASEQSRPRSSRTSR